MAAEAAGLDRPDIAGGGGGGTDDGGPAATKGPGNGKDGPSGAGDRDPLEPPPHPRTPTDSPTNSNPTPERRRLRARADRDLQRDHRRVLDPALPAADLPGLRHPVRDPLAGARLDQPDRDPLRPARRGHLDRRGDRMDAVPALDLGGLRRRRQRGRAQGPLQPGRRDLRRRPLPARRRRRDRPAHARSSPTTTPTGTSTRCCSTREQYGDLPDDLVGSITGLTEGAHFPVAAKSRYADDVSEREAAERAKEGDASGLYESSPTRRGINIYADEGAPVVAVNDGVIKKIGESPKLGNYLVLQDAYGNRYTYAELGEISEVHPVPKERDLKADDFELISPGKDPKPSGPATDAATPKRNGGGGGEPESEEPAPKPASTICQHRGHPRAPLRAAGAPAQRRPGEPLGPARPAPRRQDARRTRASSPTSPACSSSTASRWTCAPLREGSQVVAGTVLGRIGGPRSSPRTSTSRSARPAAALRRSTRSRSSTAGSCSRRRRSTAPPARTRSASRTPRSARSCCSRRRS